MNARNAEQNTFRGMPRLILIVMIVVSATMGVVQAHAELSYDGKPYLTWQGDPSTTMTITYHTMEEPAAVLAVYDKVGTSEAFRYREVGESWQIYGLEDGRFINSVELTNLEPGQDYYFRIGDGDTFSDAYMFRTIPDGDEPIRFVTGGDTLAGFIFEALVQEVAAEDPLFLSIGGDLAYADGDFAKIGRWDNWFENWHDNAVTRDGRLIPLVLAIGNHETNDLEGGFETRAPFFFGFFPQGGNVYWAHQFGAHLGFIILDTGHLVPHEDQVDFLEEKLLAYQALPFRVAMYHVPLYPSHRDFEGSRSVAGREHWLPLFDKHNLSVGFENHDHTFKRTKRLRNNELDPEGTLYIGDGNAGVFPRIPEEGRWYMEKVSRDSHFWVIDVNADEMHLRALDRNGEVFDEVVVHAAPSTP